MDAAPIINQWASIHLNQKKICGKKNICGICFYSFSAAGDIQGCEENARACGVLRLVVALGLGADWLLY